MRSNKKTPPTPHDGDTLRSSERTARTIVQRLDELLKEVKRLSAATSQTPSEAAQKAERRRSYLAQTAAWSGVVATLVTAVVGALIGLRIASAQERFTEAAPVAATYIPQHRISVTGSTTGHPQIKDVGTFVNFVVVNRGHTDAEIAAIYSGKQPTLFYTASSCGQTWHPDPTKDTTKLVSAPFVVEPGHAVAVVLWFPGSTFLLDPHLHLADGRVIAATPRNGPRGLSNSEPYIPTFEKIQAACNSPQKLGSSS